MRNDCRTLDSANRLFGKLNFSPENPNQFCISRFVISLCQSTNIHVEPIQRRSNDWFIVTSVVRRSHINYFNWLVCTSHAAIVRHLNVNGRHDTFKWHAAVRLILIIHAFRRKIAFNLSTNWNDWMDCLKRECVFVSLLGSSAESLGRRKVLEGLTEWMQNSDRAILEPVNMTTLFQMRPNAV